MVAIESAPAVDRRSVTVLVETLAPASASAASAPRSICQVCFSSGSRSRTSSTTAACASVSVSTATAPESPRIHSTCSAEDVSYTGTVIAPADQIAKSSSVHSYRVRDMTPTRSPGAMPAAIRPLAAECTSARNCAAVRSVHCPSTLRLSTATPGCRSAFWCTRSERLPPLGTW